MDSVTVKGTIQSFVAQSPSGWAVAHVVVDGGPKVTCVGIIRASVGDFVCVTGERQITKYGAQVKVATCDSSRPTDIDGAASFLAANFKGVGPKRARLILDHFGGAEKLWDALEKKELKALAAAGFGSDAREAAEAYASLRSRREADVKMRGWGMTDYQIGKACNAWGETACAVIEKNPYRLVELTGVGFVTADRIALRMHFDRQGVPRIAAGILFAAKDAAENGGHTALPRTVLIVLAQKLLALPSPAIAKVLAAHGEEILSRIGGPGGDEDRYALPRIDEDERVVDAFVKSDGAPLPADMGPVAKGGGVRLDAAQTSAVTASLFSPRRVGVITGGAGTGKTQCIRAIIDVLEGHDIPYALCAPTGKAAKRIEQLTDRGAMTIHRLLEAQGGGTFARAADNPLDARVVIADEASMIDVSLMASLMRAMHKDARLILVGDEHQLPSVGPGAVLADICSDRYARDAGAYVSRLDRVYRTGPGSWVARNAPLILRREHPNFMENVEDFRLIEVRDIGHVAQTCVALDCSPDGPDVILSPTRKHSAGTVAINAAVQSHRHAHKRDDDARAYGDKKFFVGDRVIHTQNNYGLGVFNGEVGVVTSARPDLRVRYEGRGEDVTYAGSDIGQLDLAYALTVHRSQGSEWEHVAIVVHSSHAFMLSPQIFYTAMTRAREKLTVIGDLPGIRRAVSCKADAKRYTMLPREAA